MPQVCFQPFGVVVSFAEGETVFEVGRRAGIAIPTACGGKGSCGLCRVKILAGEAALTPIGADEKKHLGNAYFISKLRLSCRIRPTGDLVVLLPDAARQMGWKP